MKLLIHLYDTLKRVIESDVQSKDIVYYSGVENEIDVLGTIIEGRTTKNKASLFKKAGILELALLADFNPGEFTEALENQLIVSFNDINGNTRYSINHRGIMKVCLSLNKNLISSISPLDKKVFDQTISLNHEERLIIMYLLAIGALNKSSTLDTDTYSNDEIQKHYECFKKIHELCARRNLIADIKWDKKKNGNYRSFFGNLDGLTRSGLCDARANKYNLNLDAPTKQNSLLHLFFRTDSITYDKILELNAAIEEVREILDYTYFFNLTNTDFKFKDNFLS